MSKRRIQLFDALRGLSILLMLGHHAAVDLIGLRVLPRWILENPVMDVLHFIFASVFILLCGFSSKFAKSNLKRGLLLLGLALAISAVTWFFPGGFIRFGVLHLLACCILIYALLQKQLDRVPYKVWFFLFAVCYVGYVVVNAGYWVNPDHLWLFGIVGPTFTSADYFPLIPWFFLFMLGTHLGTAAKEEKLPSWVYRFKSRFFSAVGRHTLIIYLVHQPIFYGIFYLLGLYN